MRKALKPSPQPLNDGYPGSTKNLEPMVARDAAPAELHSLVLGQLGAGHAGGPSYSYSLIQALKAGLPFQELEFLRKSLDLSMEKLVPILGISKATLHRRKNEGRLDSAESDRVLRLARLLGQASEVMESLENGRRWLNSPQIGLGGAVPLEYAETEVGARVVEELLGRIEYGVYS